MNENTYDFPYGATIFWVAMITAFLLSIALGGLSDPCDTLTGTEKERCEASVYYAP